jgi:hypothetical protein
MNKNKINIIISLILMIIKNKFKVSNINCKFLIKVYYNKLIINHIRIHHLFHQETKSNKILPIRLPALLPWKQLII